MEQLLNIKTIPIKVEVKVQRGEFKPVEDSGKASASAPAVKVSSKQGGGLRLQAEPYRMNISESRNYDSYTPSRSSDTGITLTYEAIARFADAGGAQGLSGEAQEFTAKKASRSIESVLQSLPRDRNSVVSYADGTLSINYQMQPLGSSEGSADILSSPKYEFVPGSIEFIISQMPKVDIEYLGEPIYFPRSANPNYEPPLDVFA